MFFKSLSSTCTNLIIFHQKSLFLESCIFESDLLDYREEICGIIRITIWKPNPKKIFNGYSKYLDQTGRRTLQKNYTHE